MHQKRQGLTTVRRLARERCADAIHPCNHGGDAGDGRLARADRNHDYNKDLIDNINYMICAPHIRAPKPRVVARAADAALAWPVLLMHRAASREQAVLFAQLSPFVLLAAHAALERPVPLTLPRRESAASTAQRPPPIRNSISDMCCSSHGGGGSTFLLSRSFHNKRTPLSALDESAYSQDPALAPRRLACVHLRSERRRHQ